MLPLRSLLVQDLCGRPWLFLPRVYNTPVKKRGLWSNKNHRPEDLQPSDMILDNGKVVQQTNWIKYFNYNKMINWYGQGHREVIKWPLGLGPLTKVNKYKFSNIQNGDLMST
jgi:hypothetical protein